MEFSIKLYTIMSERSIVYIEGFPKSIVFFSLKFYFVLGNKSDRDEIKMWHFIIYKVMKYRKILIEYNAYFKKAVFHSRENIKSCIFTAVKI